MYHEMRAPRVFIPNKSYHDFSQARTFGELVYLTEGIQDRFKLNDLYRRVTAAMIDADAMDYLLVSGPATVNAIAASILAHRFGRINFLVYDGYTGRYMSRPIVLEHTKENKDGSTPPAPGVSPAGAGALPGARAAVKSDTRT